jgi:hypothetical protein
MYLLDRTNQIISEKEHCLRLSYKATVGFFPLHLRLIHKMIYLYGQATEVFGKSIDSQKLAPVPLESAVVQASIELVQ